MVNFLKAVERKIKVHRHKNMVKTSWDSNSTLEIKKIHRVPFCRGHPWLPWGSWTWPVSFRPSEVGLQRVERNLIFANRFHWNFPSCGDFRCLLWIDRRWTMQVWLTFDVWGIWLKDAKRLWLPVSNDAMSLLLWHGPSEVQWGRRCNANFGE